MRGPQVELCGTTDNTEQRGEDFLKMRTKEDVVDKWSGTT
jgi:hypothetical protein